MNSESYPNLMRYVVFVVNFANPTYSLIFALLLIYAVPGKITYAFWAALVSLGFLPPSLVMVGIAKDQVPVGILEAVHPNPDPAKGADQ